MKQVISVILPVYNAEAHIERCLDSLLAQKYQQLEIIIVDDGSTDQSSVIIEKYAKMDSRIRSFYINHQGVSFARNCALQHVTGDWVAFCDSDDIVPPNAYYFMIKAGVRNGADMVVGGLQVLHGDYKTCFNYKKYKNKFCFFYYGPSLCNRLFRYDLLNNITFVSLLVGEDIVFLTDVFNKAEKVIAISPTVYKYINIEDCTHRSLTHCYSLEMFNEHILAWVKAKSMWQQEYLNIGNKYLIKNTIPYLYRQLTMIATIAEKYKALQNFKLLLCQLDWRDDENLFAAIFGLSYSNFCKMTSEEYFNYVISLDCKEQVLLQFAEGRIGFKYILKYLFLWIKYKFRRGIEK